MIGTMKSALIGAVTLLALAGTSATAAPVSKTPAPQAATQQSLPLLSIQHRHRRDWRRHRYNRHHRHFRPGWRYRSAPRHWRRYGHRPHDWRRRGCIIVGPVWFCP